MKITTKTRGIALVALVCMVTSGAFAQTSDQSLGNKLQNRPPPPLPTPASGVKHPGAPTALLMESLGVPGWKFEHAFVVQPSHSTNPDNSAVGRGAWFSRQDYAFAASHEARGAAWKFGFETDSKFYEHSARSNDEIDPTLGAGFESKLGESSKLSVGVVGGYAIINGDVAVGILNASGGVEFPLGGTKNLTLTLALSLEQRDFRAALSGLTATRSQPGMVLNYAVDGGPIFHVGFARLYNAARTAPADNTTDIVSVSSESWALIKKKLTLAGSFEFGRRMAGHSFAPAPKRRDDITTVGLKLVHAMNAASAVVADWSYTRQNSNSVTDSYSETILRLGMAFKF